MRAHVTCKTPFAPCRHGKAPTIYSHQEREYVESLEQRAQDLEQDFWDLDEEKRALEQRNGDLRQRNRLLKGQVRDLERRSKVTRGACTYWPTSFSRPGIPVYDLFPPALVTHCLHIHQSLVQPCAAPAQLDGTSMPSQGGLLTCTHGVCAGARALDKRALPGPRQGAAGGLACARPLHAAGGQHPRAARAGTGATCLALQLPAHVMRHRKPNRPDLMTALAVE